MTTSRFLHQHGTRAFELKPGAVVQAAISDLKVRDEKLPRDNAEGDPELQGRQYAFVAEHVRRARSAAELIQLALDNPEDGVASGKVNTRIIYSDPELLRAALEKA